MVFEQLIKDLEHFLTSSTFWVVSSPLPVSFFGLLLLLLHCSNTFLLFFSFFFWHPPVPSISFDWSSRWSFFRWLLWIFVLHLRNRNSYKLWYTSGCWESLVLLLPIMVAGFYPFTPPMFITHKGSKNQTHVFLLRPNWVLWLQQPIHHV